MNTRFLKGTSFTPEMTRRNVFVEEVELMWLIGRRFQIGQATFVGVKYCDPCMRPSKLSVTKESFKNIFEDCGGLIAVVIEGGLIKIGDLVIPPPKGY